MRLQKRVLVGFRDRVGQAELYAYGSVVYEYIGDARYTRTNKACYLDAFPSA